MKSVDIRKATASLADYAKGLDEESVVVTSRGKPLALLMPVDEDEDLESMALSMNPKFMAIIEKSRESYRKHGGISSEEMRRRLDVPPAKKTRKTKGK